MESTCELAQKYEDTTQASESMQIGCMNVRVWGTGEFEDVCKELDEWMYNVVLLTETHLRGSMTAEENEYVMIGKGCEKQGPLGGGAVLCHQKKENLKV